MLLKGLVKGPESLILDGDTFYAGTIDGKILQIKDGQIQDFIELGDPICGMFLMKFKFSEDFEELPKCGRVLGIRWLNSKEIVVADAYFGILLVNFQTSKTLSCFKKF